MYIYTMCFNANNGAIRVMRTEVAKETANAYKMVDNSTVNKNMLGVINTTYIGYGYRMKTLEPDIEMYKERVRKVIMKQYESTLKAADNIKSTAILLDGTDKIQYLF